MSASMHNKAVEMEPLQEQYQTQKERRATHNWQEECDEHCLRQLQPPVNPAVAATMVKGSAQLHLESMLCANHTALAN